MFSIILVQCYSCCCMCRSHKKRSKTEGFCINLAMTLWTALKHSGLYAYIPDVLWGYKKKGAQFSKKTLYQIKRKRQQKCTDVLSIIHKVMKRFLQKILKKKTHCSPNRPKFCEKKTRMKRLTGYQKSNNYQDLHFDVKTVPEAKPKACKDLLCAGKSTMTDQRKFGTFIQSCTRF